jgi:hypothetical protein
MDLEGGDPVLFSGAIPAYPGDTEKNSDKPVSAAEIQITYFPNA